MKTSPVSFGQVVVYMDKKRLYDTDYLRRVEEHSKSINPPRGSFIQFPSDERSYLQPGRALLLVDTPLQHIKTAVENYNHAIRKIAETLYSTSDSAQYNFVKKSMAVVFQTLGNYSKAEKVKV